MNEGHGENALTFVSFSDNTFKMDDVKRLLEAAAFAARKHSGQKRKGKDEEPYINHPLEVANLLVSVGGIDDIDVLAAGLLHDTIEDTGATRADIEEKFGSRTANIVAEVTDDKSLPKAERKRLQIVHAPHLSNDAKLVKLADKISNITDILDRPPSDWDDQRRREYIDWGVSVVDGLRGTNTELEARFDELVARAKRELE
jgi:GTP diphosphokinase / guanosine-3',5'-bis(diphosphate) 3'-diphosphatase